MCELLQRQMELEEECLGLGVTRYRKNLEDTHLPWSDKLSTKKAETDMPPGMQLLKASVMPLAAAIERYIENNANVKRRRPTTVLYLQLFDPYLVAFLTAKHCLNGMSRRELVQRVALNIANNLEDELEYRAFKEEHPGLFHYTARKLQKVTSERHRRTVMMGAKRYAGTQDINWSTVDKVKMGQRLIHMMVESTGLVDMVRMSSGKNNTKLYVQGTESAKAWLKEGHARCEVMSPIQLPMVVPPKKWTNPTNGGYLTPAMGNMSLVKTRNEAYLEELENFDMPVVYDAVNAIQETPWRINKGVLSVMQEVWDSGGTLGGLPMRDDLPLPAKPHDIDTNDEAKRDWKREAAKVWEENARLMSKRSSTAQKIWVAEKFVDYKAIYFPTVCDWRGRIYPVPSFVNPQSDDSGRALLHFAEGVPLGEEGHIFLAIHGANTYGEDKASFTERVQWVLDNEEMILDCAMNPLSCRSWCDAAEPYSFLAFCFEWLGYSMEGAEYVSHLPIQFDGSNNGIQHLSAMMRDVEGGRATNLLPSDKPADIYSDVAKVVAEHVNADAASGVPYASAWVGHIDRGICKRPVMTYAYGVTLPGVKQQLIDHIKKSPEHATDGDVWEPCSYLAPILYTSVCDFVPEATKAMKWLQEVARVAAKADLPIHWVAPSGFWVLQEYRKAKASRIETYLGGVRQRITIMVDGSKLDRRKQVAGVSPNFVHSADAAALLSCVVKCKQEGINSFSAIHDSYGVHAAYCYRLSHLLREAFVEQYQGNVLEDFRAQIVDQLPAELAEEIPPTPTQGTLDIQAVMESDYFFA